MFSLDLKGKRALVTGGSSGIGLATASLFAANGATVAINYLPDDPLAVATLRRLRREGLNVLDAPGDVSDAADARSCVSRAIDEMGGLDFLINNAGTAATHRPIPFSELDAMTEPFWAKILSTNLIGPFRCSHAASAALKASHGAIVNTASVAGLGLRGSSIAYAASKAGLINLTKTLATALAPDVRVNAVAPGLISTEWIADWPEERKKSAAERALLGRIGTPDEVATSILFLASAATFVTGQTLAIDGGSL
ncbi:SDR family NAD(P)-dependent oxidoreductase [Microvirga pudoricolor]|uniref:SDR family NAD(P)-dependent oxidoreductase n=1 Tax=Microvirga pudoricolor TaxID=2778729 RepID=UPI0019510F85|nr:SDR family oxidoreductase [Microvirga pudoricolor]MBM6593131.1 SDR family oxidoreductase [Microvirga pudoricolor]